MRVLVAPDSFGGALPAVHAARAIATGWSTAAPGDDVRSLPLTDGGAGFLRTLHATLGHQLLSATVRAPCGGTAPAALLVVDDAAGVRTAYVEAAHAIAPELVPVRGDGPVRGASVGVGDLLVLARRTGARRVVVGVGAAATTDAGAGMLAALGVGAGSGVLAAGGLALSGVTDADLSGLQALRADWAQVELVAACAQDLPLLGLHGASAGATVHGVTAEQSQALERSLGHFSHAAVAALGAGAVRRDLLAPGRSGTPTARLAGQRGAGAGGGLGFGLALLGARLVPGAAFAADELDLTGRLADVDLAVTGAGTVDWRSLHDAVTATVAQRALTSGVPTVVIGREVLVGRRELAAAGIAAAYPVAGTSPVPQDAADDPAGSLAARAARVARTWSR